MSTPARTWSLAGLAAGGAGLAASYLVATLLGIRESPVVAVAETVVVLTPGAVAEALIAVVGRADKPLLVIGVVLVVAALLAWAGRLARRTWWAAVAVYVALAVVAGACVLGRRGTGAGDLVPVAAGLAVWVMALSVLVDPLRAADRERDGGEAAPTGSRRGFLLAVAGVAAVSALGTVAARFAGRGRRTVELSRQLLRIPGVSEPRVPASVRLDLAGVAPWATPVEDFYRIDTSIASPAIEPSEWRLRIHGLVDRELVLTYDDLLARELTEAWITLNCVSNVVGGPLIGNAWWSGVRLADLLEEAGMSPEADALLQTSDDGWTCGTPISVVTDGRDAMLAVAMDGLPLPIDHGFPVRTIVPGLYGYVSATKWLVDIEVTRFSDFTAYWTERGWGEMGPVKMSSRIEAPRSGSTVTAGAVRVGGTAWAQHTGIEGVEVALDGGAWVPATLRRVPSEDCWVPWEVELDLPEGDHQLRVRATDTTGEVQTGVERDVLPDGSTGWHSISVTAAAG